jgi:hypothetical protein
MTGWRLLRVTGNSEVAAEIGYIYESGTLAVAAFERRPALTEVEGSGFDRAEIHRSLQ